MARHIDVIENDPLAGVQRRVARVIADGDAVHVEPAGWAQRVEQLAGPLNGRAPEEYLTTVIDRLADATYVTASDVHGDDACPFARSDELSVSPQRERHLAGA